MCFGIRILSPFHLATSILPIENHKHPQNAKNALIGLFCGQFSSKENTIASLLQVTSISVYNSAAETGHTSCSGGNMKIHWFETFFTWEVVDQLQAWPPPDQGAASIGAFLAFLGYLWFWMGNIKVARWNGVDFLIPKHMRKSKIGLLEQIWAQNPYDTFFWVTLYIISNNTTDINCK